MNIGIAELILLVGPAVTLVAFIVGVIAFSIHRTKKAKERYELDCYKAEIERQNKAWAAYQEQWRINNQRWEGWN